MQDIHTQKSMLRLDLHVSCCSHCLFLYRPLLHGVLEPEVFVKEIIELLFHLYSGKYALYKSA